MHPIGYSTGSLACGDFRKALRMLEAHALDALELSALRLRELPELVQAAGSLRLDGYRHVSLHAPSAFTAQDEPAVLDLLSRITHQGWDIVVHPDTMHDVSRWRSLGAVLCVENMDKRKPVGRTSAELDRLFDALPDAGLCFDIAHARQCDPSMLEAYRILHAHRDRLRQVHISEVGTTSRHSRLSFGAIQDYREVARFIPEHVPIIIESPVSEDEIESEVERAREALAALEPAFA